MEITDSANKFHFDLMLPRCSGDMTHSMVSIAGKDRNDRNYGFQTCLCRKERAQSKPWHVRLKQDIHQINISIFQLLIAKAEKNEIKGKYALHFLVQTIS